MDHDRLRHYLHHRHHRGDVLRQVSARLDHLALDDQGETGAPPAMQVALDCAGVVDTFADDVDLVAALLLRWNARLSARLDLALGTRPDDLPAAVARAWAATARDLPGVRRLVDEQWAEPGSERMRAMLGRARDKEHCRLAWAAGLSAGAESPRAAAAGARLERAGRDRLALRTASSRPIDTPTDTPTAAPHRRPGTTVSGTSNTFVQRLRALMPA